MAEKNYEKMIRDAFDELVNKNKTDRIDHFFSQNAIIRDGRLKINGLSELTEVLKGRGEAIPDYSCTVDDVIVSGNKVAARWHAEGFPIKDTGDFKAGTPINYQGITFFEIKNDRIDKVWQYGTGVDISLS